MLYSKLIRPLLFRLDSESVHHQTSALATGLCSIRPLRTLLSRCLATDDPVKLFGVRFPNRVGLAAGFDKAAKFAEAAECLGFGHLEVGAVTPLPQEGHPRPRLFRHPEFRALRNRMGFNNDGALAVARRLAARASTLPVGVNLGKGKDTPLEAAVEDYAASLGLLFGFADFFVINVSSPNTDGLRGLQDTVGSLMAQLRERNQECSQKFGIAPKPLLVKVSPDQSNQQLVELAQRCAEAGVSGLVATNTLASRRAPLQNIPDLGGISGAPLAERALEVVSLLRQTLGSAFPLIGVGGIDSPESALAMRAAGADLIQVYTGFVYGGPGLPRELARTLKEHA